MNFFETCLVELNDHVSEELRYNAISHRASKLDVPDFEKFMRDSDGDEKQPIVGDHEANLRKMQGK